MRKLIIGCGYVGKRLAACWHSRGEDVYATTRKREQAEAFARQGWHPVLCDIADPQTIQLPAAEVVVFAVGFDRTSGRDMREVYVDGLSHVLDRLAACGRFIYVSSTSVYGQT